MLKHRVHYALVSGFALASIGAQADGHLESFETHSHFSFSVNPNVVSHLEKHETKTKKGTRLTGFTLIFDGVSCQDKALTGRDIRTEQIRQKTMGDKKCAIEVSLSDEAQQVGVEYFDYRAKNGTEYYLDYWNKKLEIQKQVATSARKKIKVVKNTKLQKKKVFLLGNEVATAASSTKADFYGDKSAGCGVPLNIDEDPFVFFNRDYRVFDYKEKFKLSSADTGYHYPHLKDDLNKVDNEAQRKELAHYKLAFKLFSESSFALVLRTIQFFDQTYPQSELNGELSFLAASTLLKLGELLKSEHYYEQAYDSYRRQILENPKSDRAKRAIAFLVQEFMRKGAPSRAMEYLVTAMDYYPQTEEHHWVYKLALAESLLLTKEYDRAERVFQNIIDNKEKSKSIGKEAFFRIGSVFLARGHKERGILHLEYALRSDPKEALKFPEIWINLGEIYLKDKRFKDAKRIYSEYVTNFPSDEKIWAGRLRLAELNQLMMSEKDPRRDKEVQSLYQKVVNEHPYTPGAYLAELRLSDCTFTSNNVFFEDLFKNRELEQASDRLIVPREVEAWFDLAKAKFNVRNKHYAAAMEKIDFYKNDLQKNPLKEAFHKVFSDALVGMVEQGIHGSNNKAILNAAETYGEFAPKNASFAFQLTVLKALSGENRISEVKEKIEDLDRTLVQNPLEPTDEQKDLFHLLKAKYLFQVSSNPDLAAAEFALIKDDGKLWLEKNDGLSQASLRKGDYRSSFDYDSKILNGPIEKVSLEQGLQFAIRRLESAKKIQGFDPAELAKLSERALLRFGTLTEHAEELNHIREIQALAAYDAKGYRDALDLLGKLIELDPKSSRRGEYEYKRGRSLAAIGREQEALDVYRKVAQESDGIWKKSAQAEIDQREWEDQISKEISKKSPKQP
ncbi:MAG: tetratricopeptide repeat protein [Bacteriovoracia bacterium]